MTDKRIELSRRKLLAGLGSVGVASAGAGLGTTALFSDGESFENNSITAGTLDLKVDWEEHYYNSLGGGGQIGSVRQVDGESDVENDEVGLPDPRDPIIAVDEDDLSSFMDGTTLEQSGPVDNPSPGLVDLNDVKPGDFGEVTFSYHLSGNPGYVAMSAEKVADAENGVNEPEASSSEEDDPRGSGSGDNMSGELGDAIQAALWYDPNCNNLRDSGDSNVVESGTLNEVLARLGTDGTVLDPSLSGGTVDEDFGGNCHAPRGGGPGDCEETLYLTDSGPSGTVLFEVNLNESNNRAELTEKVTMPADDFDQVDAIAATPDGTTLYAIDKNSGHLGEYDVGSDTFTDLGELTGTNVSGFPGVTVSAAYGPGGVLYMVSAGTDGIYTVDPGAVEFTYQATLNKSITPTDITFAADGTAYIISTETSDNRALYTFDPSDGSLTKKGNGTGERFTGLGVRAAGAGNLVGSATSDDSVYVIERDGDIGDQFEMYEGGSRYDYDYGDMTVGELCGDQPTGHCVALAWWLPRDVGNEVQSDSYAFDVTFRTEQCRNNDNPFS